MNTNTKTRALGLGLMGFFALVSCGPNGGQSALPMPVGAELHLAASSPVSARKMVALEVSVQGRRVDKGNVLLFDRFSATAPFLSEVLENQLSKKCAPAAQGALSGDYAAVVFCESGVAIESLGRLEYVDSAGKSRHATAAHFARSDARSGVDVYFVDFL
jgi:hypothetical protein